MQQANTNCVSESILSALKYFHIFRHPIYFHELYRFINIEIDEQTIHSTLKELLCKRHIFLHDCLYMVVDEPALAVKRLKGSKMASERMPEAYNSARIIANFPFVKAVFISGSLSKGYADEKTDIDFFIITNTKRLWICRTVLHLFKKATFLVNKQHSFCMNYFIDEARLQIEEFNNFTATEIATLIPVYNYKMYTRFMQRNQRQLYSYFPNFIQKAPPDNEPDTGLTKKLFESLINLLFPCTLNTGLMRMTDRLWRRKWEKKDFPMHEYDIAMKTKWYVSKNHPANYQKRVLSYLKPQT